MNRYNKIIEVINDKAKEYIIWDFDEKLEVILGKKLIKKSLTISTVESCTGGLLGSAITSVAGSSEYYIGGIIAYSNEIKCKELNVPIDILENFGAVSKETAEILAYEQRLKFKTDLSISITGIAGPAGGSLEKPVGTVYIGISTKFKTFSKLISMGLGRDSVRQKTVITALIMLIKEIDLIDLI
ncbi:MAG: CinA family protein [Chlorobi bacterium]|nr:CinA family protein [Chlorobiota bacterium]